MSRITQSVVAAGLLAGVFVTILAGTGCTQSPEVKKQRALERGEQFLKESKANEAIIELRNALQIDRDFVPALHALGRAYMLRSWYADAVRDLSRAQKLAPNSVPIAVDLTRSLIEAGALQEAETQARQILKREPTNGIALHLRAESLLAQRKGKEALEVLDRAEAEGIQLPPEARTLRGEVLFVLGKADEAEKVLEGGLAADPKDVRGLVGLANVKLARGKPEDAARLYADAKAIRPTDPRIRLGLSIADARLGKLKEAITELEGLDMRARTAPVVVALGAYYIQANRGAEAAVLLRPLVQAAPKFTQARYLLGVAHLASNNPAEGITELEEVDRQLPSDPGVKFRLAQGYRALGRPREALSALAGVAKQLEKIPAYHLERGRGLLLLGRVDEAQAAAREAQRLAPQSPEPLLLLGQANAQAGDSKAAREAFSKAAEVDASFAPAHLALGGLFAAEKDLTAAGREFDLAAKANPRSFQAVRAKAAALVLQNKVKEAVGLIEDAARADSTSANPQALLGRLYVQDGQPDKARAAYEKAVELDRRAVAPRLGLTGLAIKQGREDDAVTQLQAIVRERPGHQVAALLLSALYDRRSQYDQSIAVLEAAAKADPGLASFQLSLADAYVKKGRYDDAVARMSQFLGRFPDNSHARIVRARAYLGKREGEAALKDVGEVVRINPKSGFAHYLLGRTYALLARPDEARAAYREALKLAPDLQPARVELAALSGDKPDSVLLEKRVEQLREEAKKTPKNMIVREELARALLAAGKRKEAEAELKQVLETAPGLASANLLMAQVLVAQGRRDEAASFVKAILRANPGHLQANVALAAYLRERGRYEEAANHLEAAVRVSPAQPDLKFQLGLLYAATGRDADALRLAAEVEKAAPNHPLAPALKGVVLLRQKKSKEAIDAFTSALRLGGGVMEVHRGLGQAYGAVGEHDRSIEHYRRALAMNDRDVLTLNNLAWALSEYKRKPEEAWALAAKAYELKADSVDVMDTVGWIQYRRGAYAEAEKILSKATEQAPNHAGLHYHLGMTYRRLGRSGEALSALRRAAELDPGLARSEGIAQVIRELGG